jgi:hypothetical protein
MDNMPGQHEHGQQHPKLSAQAERARVHAIVQIGKLLPYLPDTAIDFRMALEDATRRGDDGAVGAIALQVDDYVQALRVLHRID